MDSAPKHGVRQSRRTGLATTERRMLTSCGRRNAAIGLGHLDVLPTAGPGANPIEAVAAVVRQLRAMSEQRFMSAPMIRVSESGL